MELPIKEKTGQNEVQWVERNLRELMTVDVDACEKLIDDAIDRELWTICADTYALDERVRSKTFRKLINLKEMPVEMKSKLLRQTEPDILLNANIAIWTAGFDDADIQYWLDCKPPERIFTEIARSPDMLKWYESYRETLLSKGITYICNAVHLTPAERLDLAKKHLADRLERNDKFTKREFRAAAQAFRWKGLQQLVEMDRSCMLPSASYQLWNIIDLLADSDTIDALPAGRVDFLDDDGIDHQTRLAFKELKPVQQPDRAQFERSAPKYTSTIRVAARALPRTMFEIMTDTKCRKPTILRELLRKTKKLIDQPTLTWPEKLFVSDTLYLVALSPGFERAQLPSLRKNSIQAGIVKMYRAFIEAGTAVDEFTLEDAEAFIGPNSAACIAAAKSGIIQTVSQLRQLSRSGASTTPMLL